VSTLPFKAKNGDCHLNQVIQELAGQDRECPAIVEQNLRLKSLAPPKNSQAACMDVAYLHPKIQSTSNVQLDHHTHIHNGIPPRPVKINRRLGTNRQNVPSRRLYHRQPPRRHPHEHCACSASQGKFTLSSRPRSFAQTPT
jgi:hypothetical protein